MTRLRLLAALVLGPASLAGQQTLLRQADSAFEAGSLRLADSLYRRVLAADPGASRAVYRLAQLSPDRAAALALFRRYTALEPEDPWGFLAVGDTHRRLGQDRSALRAYEAAARLAPDEPDVVSRIGPQRHRVRPALEPVAAWTSDSDDNTTLRYGLGGDVLVGEAVRVGLLAQRTEVRSPGAEAALGEGLVTVRLRSGGLRVDAGAGGSQLPAGPNTESTITPTGDLRLRWRSASDAVAIEARGQRMALAASPELLTNQVLRREARLGLDVAAGPVRLRGMGRLGAMTQPGEDANRRLQGDAAVVLPVGPAREVSVQYHRLGYERPATSGYFAPARVETVEAGSSLEFGDALVVALDLGAGAQRVQEHEAGPGSWQLALRGYAYLAVPLGTARQLRVEAEAYQAPFAPEGAVTSENWRYLSLGVSLRWAF